MTVKEQVFESIQDAVNYFSQYLPDANSCSLNFSRQEFNVHDSKITLSATRIEEASGSYWDVWI
jgi:hypothetical protein